MAVNKKSGATGISEYSTTLNEILGSCDQRDPNGCGPPSRKRKTPGWQTYYAMDKTKGTARNPPTAPIAFYENNREKPTVFSTQENNQFEKGIVLSQPHPDVHEQIDNNQRENNADDDVDPVIAGEDDTCPLCKVEVAAGQLALNCETCMVWFHKNCL